MVSNERFSSVCVDVEEDGDFLSFEVWELQRAGTLVELILVAIDLLSDSLFAAFPTPSLLLTKDLLSIEWHTNCVDATISFTHVRDEPFVEVFIPFGMDGKFKVWGWLSEVPVDWVPELVVAFGNEDLLRA